jgi:hypothetical protein
MIVTEHPEQTVDRRFNGCYGPATEEEEVAARMRVVGDSSTFLRCSDVNLRRSGAVAWADLRCLRRLLLLL